MSGEGNPSTRPEFRLDLAQMYREAIIDFAEHDDADRLEWAYHIARSALRSGLPLAAISDIHYGVVRGLTPDDVGPSDRAERLEVFFLEVVAVHDMALRGYKDSVQRLENEVAERCKVERELREVTSVLAKERDELDFKVRERTTEIEARADELRRANAKLVQINREQAEFTYAISHDLKSPTNTIKMMLDILRTDHMNTLSADGRAILDAALQTAIRMGAVAEGVLHYSSSLEQGEKLKPVCLDDVLEKVQADLTADIVSSDAKVHVGPLPSVMGNELQLRLLFQNLVSNAVKYRSADRSPVVEVSEVPEQSDRVCISVKDNGIGIDQKFQDRIFGLFQRLHTHDAFPGTGIGLTLCKRIAANHGGGIRVASSPGKGAEFTVKLRRAQVS